MGTAPRRLDASDQESLLESIQCATNLLNVLSDLDNVVHGPGAIARIPLAALDTKSPTTTSFAITTSHATGTIVADGSYLKVDWQSTDKARASITGSKKYAHNPVRGHFYVTVGKPTRRPPGPRAYRADGTAAEVPSNLTGAHLTTLTRAELAREVRTMANRQDINIERLFRRCKPVIGNHIAKAQARATAAIDRDDVEQEANELVLTVIGKFLAPDERPSTNLVNALCVVAARDLARLEEKGKTGYGEDTRRWHKFFHSQQADLDLATTTPEQWAERWYSRDNVQRTRTRQRTGGRDASITYLDTVSEDEFNKTVAQIKRALCWISRVETPASLDETVPGGDDESMTLGDSLTDETTSVEEQAVRSVGPSAMSVLTSKWFAGSGLTDEQLDWGQHVLEFFRKATHLGLKSQERAERFAADSMFREMTFVIQPLLAIDETITNPTHLNRVSDRFRALMFEERDNGRLLLPRSEEEVERAWALALTDPQRQDRSVELLNSDTFTQSELVDVDAEQHITID